MTSRSKKIKVGRTSSGIVIEGPLVHATVMSARKQIMALWKAPSAT